MPTKREAGREEKMKRLIKTVVAAAAFPLGAIAAQPAKTMTERGVTEKVSAPRIQFAYDWLDS